MGGEILQRCPFRKTLRPAVRNPGRTDLPRSTRISVRPPLLGPTGLRYYGAVAWDQVATIVVTVVLAVLAGTGYNNRRFDDVNQRFDDVHRRIDDLRADVNARFAQLDTRLAQVDARLSELREDLREIRGLLHEALPARAG